MLSCLSISQNFFSQPFKLLQSDDANAGTHVETNSNPANRTVETEKGELIFLIMIIIFLFVKLTFELTFPNILPTNSIRSYELG